MDDFMPKLFQLQQLLELVEALAARVPTARATDEPAEAEPAVLEEGELLGSLASCSWPTCPPLARGDGSGHGSGCAPAGAGGPEEGDLAGAAAALTALSAEVLRLRQALAELAGREPA